MRKKARARDLGLNLPGTPGPHNAITDVPGVMVGYCTLNDRSPDDTPINTGVTAILPRGRNTVPQPVFAGQFSLNGNGEMTGSHWIRDGGYFTGPIAITNTHSVGVVHHAATRWMIRQYRDVFDAHHVWAMPVIAETYDGVLNDINQQAITAEHALQAFDAATDQAPAEGNVGGGTGMICYGFKGGTGTASRLIELEGNAYTIAALVQANHGQREWLGMLGVPVGMSLKNDLAGLQENGSIIVILATDAPLSPLGLEHLARRAAIGIGRHGTPGGNNSGDIFLAFSTANAQSLPQLSPVIQRVEFLNSEYINPCYLAAVESVEEAVINAMLAAQTMATFKPGGLQCNAVDHDHLVELLHRHGQIRQ